MPSEKYVIVVTHFAPDAFSIPPVVGEQAPTKTTNDAHRAKSAEMINAGKMVKGTLGTKSSPDTPGGNNYLSHDLPKLFPDRNTNYEDTYRPWTTNIYYSYDASRNAVVADYPHLRSIPESWKGLRVLKKEHAQEWIDWCLSIGAELAEIISEEEVLALAPEMELPDDSIIDQHVVNTDA